MLIENPERESPLAANAVRPHAGRVRARLPLDSLPIQLQSAGFQWRIAAGLLREIGTATRLVEAVERPEPGTVIKTGPHRTVVRLELASGDFYVKHFRITGWRTFLQNLIRPCKAALEWQALCRVAELGLPTVQPVGLGREQRRGFVWDSYLVTQSIEGALALDEFLAADVARSKRPDIRQSIATALGQLLGQMHARGAIHPDLHPGNLLIRFEGDQPRLWLIDLHGVRFPAAVSLSEAAASLAALHQFFSPRTTKSDRLRFFQAYSAARGWTLTEAREAWPTFAAECERATQNLWDRADRAWVRGNRHQRLLDAPHAACRGLATLDATWLTGVRDSPETLFEQGLQWWCKRSGKRRVAAVTVPSGRGPSRAFLKAIEHTGTTRWLERLRRSPVRSAWETGHAFLRRGIATPRPLLFVEARGPDADCSYLLTEAVPQSLTLAEFTRAVWPQLTRSEQSTWLDGVSRAFARQLRWMHDCRFDHRDLKFENILVSEDAARTETWLLDLDAVRRWPVWLRIRAVQNLARLNVSTFHLPRLSLSERLRFLLRYLAPAERAEWKTWWKQIAAKSRKKEQQNRRRGRPLS